MCAGEADAGARRVHRVGGRGGDRQARGCNVLRAVNGPSRRPLPYYLALFSIMSSLILNGESLYRFDKERP